MSSSTPRHRRRVPGSAYTAGHAFATPLLRAPRAESVIPARAAARPAPPAELRFTRTGRPTTHLGPYESRYDIALGYGLERSILLP
jgi:hypothetical protein